MIPIAQRRHKRLLAVHGWSGITLGILLYAILLTGVIAVFADEIGDWSSPLGHEPQPGLPLTLDAPLRNLAQTLPKRYLEEIIVFKRAGGRLFTYFHGHLDAPDPETGATERGMVVLFDEQGNEISRREAYDTEAFEIAPADALAEFFVDLHVRLHVPNPWGFLLTGLLGFAMLLASISGIFIHRHLLAELFTLRRGSQPLLERRDAHATSASWNLPFCILLAFTGSFFSFAGSFGLPAMAMVAFEGDMERMQQELLGEAEPPGEKRATVASLDAILSDASSRNGSAPVFLEVLNWGRDNAQVAMNMAPGEGQLTGPVLVYDGVSGAYEQTRPGLGRVPSTGGTLVALMTPLHFGHFAGVLSKSIWFALGAAVVYVTFTGMRLWVERRITQPGIASLEKCVNWAGFGLPTALAAATLGFFVFGAGYMMPVFLIVLAASACYFAVIDAQRRGAHYLLILTGVLLLMLPLVRVLAGGPGPAAAFEAGLLTVLGMDVLLIVGGAGCVYRGTSGLRVRDDRVQPLSIVSDVA